MARLTRTSMAEEAAAQANAAAEASEAGRILQAQGQAARSDVAKPEPVDERTEPIERAPIKRRNEPRDQAMEEIYNRKRPTDPVDTPESEAKAEPAKAPEPAAQEVQPTPSPTAEQVQGWTGGPEAAPVVAVEQVPAPIETVRVKVDGEEFDALKADVDEAGGVQAYRILKAQENRLKKSGQDAAEVRQMRADILAALQQRAAPQTPQKSQQEVLTEAMQKIRFGTDEEAVAAMAALQQQGRVDPQAIIAQATNQMRHDAAVAEFDREFKDVGGNPHMLKYTTVLRNERMANIRGPVDWSHFYRTIGNEVRSAFGKASQPARALAAATDPPSPVLDKEARKATIVNLPTAAARAALPEAEKPESRAQILDSYRKARGIPTG